MKSSVAADFLSGSAGAWTILVTLPKIKSSLRAMCSAHSATDQVFSSGLKFHWAGERPATESRNCWRNQLTATIVHGSTSSPARDYGLIETMVTDRGATVSESLPS